MKAYLLLALALGGCGAKHVATAPEPVVKTVEVKVAQPVPCDALASIGPVPSYPDTDAALAAAPDIFEETRLLLSGRIMRIKRAMQYEAAKTACVF